MKQLHQEHLISHLVLPDLVHHKQKQLKKLQCIQFMSTIILRLSILVK